MSLGLVLFSAQVAVSDTGHGTESKSHMRGEGASSEDMKSRREKMQTRMEEQQSKLDELAARMNQATGQEKVDAMSALLNELVGQRKALRDRIADRMSQSKEDGRYDGDEGASKTPGKSR
jgi:phage shock protein A